MIVGYCDGTWGAWGAAIHMGVYALSIGWIFSVAFQRGLCFGHEDSLSARTIDITRNQSRRKSSTPLAPTL